MVSPKGSFLNLCQRQHHNRLKTSGQIEKKTWNFKSTFIFSSDELVWNTKKLTKLYQNFKYTWNSVIVYTSVKFQNRFREGDALSCSFIISWLELFWYLQHIRSHPCIKRFLLMLLGEQNRSNSSLVQHNIEILKNFIYEGSEKKENPWK